MLLPPIQTSASRRAARFAEAASAEAITGARHADGRSCRAPLEHDQRPHGLFFWFFPFFLSRFSRVMDSRVKQTWTEFLIPRSLHARPVLRALTNFQEGIAKQLEGITVVPWRSRGNLGENPRFFLQPNTHLSLKSPLRIGCPYASTQKI